VFRENSLGLQYFRGHKKVSIKRRCVATRKSSIKIRKILEQQPTAGMIEYNGQLTMGAIFSRCSWLSDVFCKIFSLIYSRESRLSRICTGDFSLPMSIAAVRFLRDKKGSRIDTPKVYPHDMSAELEELHLDISRSFDVPFRVVISPGDFCISHIFVVLSFLHLNFFPYISYMVHLFTSSFIL